MMTPQQATLNDLRDLADPRVAVIYCHVEDADELNQRIRDGITYVEEELGYDDLPGTTRDALTNPEKSGTGHGDTRGGEAAAVFYDDPETHPAEVEHLVDTVSGGESNGPEIDDVILPRLTTMSESYRDVLDVVETLIENDVNVHVIDRGIEFNDDGKTMSVLRAVAGEERRNARRDARRKLQTRETGSYTGRPRIGFTVEDGHLQPADDYDELCAALESVDQGDMTEYQASKVTGFSRDAIRRAVEEHPELYRLDD